MAAAEPATPDVAQAAGSASLPWWVHGLPARPSRTFNQIGVQHRLAHTSSSKQSKYLLVAHNRASCSWIQRLNPVLCMCRWVRYTRWRPTSRAEAVAAETKLLELCKYGLSSPLLHAMCVSCCSNFLKCDMAPASFMKCTMPSWCLLELVE